MIKKKGSVLLGLGVFLSGNTSNFMVFVFTYGILFGVSAGIIYMIPFNCSYMYFPDKKGTVSG